MRQLDRVALIADIAGKAPQGHLGRTALMKYFYFLQTLCQVPLDYHFTLYSYGPFDSDVLADLDAAEVLGAVRVSLIPYPGGYGFEIRRGETAGEFIGQRAESVEASSGCVASILREFGSLSSSQLELVSTIIYVGHEAARSGNQLTPDSLASRVHEIKPHFEKETILRWASDLQSRELVKPILAGNA